MTTLATSRPIFGPYCGNLLAVRPYGYNPGTCKAWGSIRVTLGLYEDNGKENGNYYNGLYRIVRFRF